jgi:hypothetical protein
MIDKYMKITVHAKNLLDVKKPTWSTNDMPVIVYGPVHVLAFFRLVTLC